MELIFRECGTDHDFPQTRLEATQTKTDRHGHIVNVNRVACRRCGTVKVIRWHAPDPPASPQSVLAIGSFERLEPISPRTPAPARSYASITEVSCRFRTGYVVLREIGGRILDLPPLPARHGDYRLRFHVGEAGCLLQIWPHPRAPPTSVSPADPTVPKGYSPVSGIDRAEVSGALGRLLSIPQLR